MQLVSFLPLLSSSYSFLFVASGILITKLYIWGSTFPQGKRLPFPAMYNPWLFFIAIVGCSAFIDLSWVIKLLSITYAPNLDYRFVLLAVRLAWAFGVLERLLAILFLKYMTDKNYRLTLQDKLLIGASSLVMLYFIILAFTNFSISDVQTRAVYMLTDPLEAKMMRYCVYFFDLLIIMYACLVMNSSFYTALPSFLRPQMRNFVLVFILPYAISTIVINLQTFSTIEIFISKVLGQGSYIIEIFSHLLITGALIYCVRRLMCFLGMSLLVPREPSKRKKP